jgi:hypothetical protein
MTVLPMLALVILWAYCLRDFVRTPEAQMRTFPRSTWVLLLVFGNVFGGVMWLTMGRPPRR